MNLSALVAQIALPVVLALVGFGFAAFLSRFLFPAVAGVRTLDRLQRRIAELRSAARSEPAVLDPVFALPVLEDLWREYCRTLHVGRDGAVRATAPAAAFFTRDALADTRYRDDFVRHLPGLFTGVGIIGTFVGLITGIEQLLPGGSTTALVQMTDHIPKLLASVKEAFYVSGFAIGAAILTTLFEKWVLSSLYVRADRIALAVDSTFEGGAVETYLERAALAAETQAAALEGLAGTLAERIARSIAESIAEPLRRIGEVVEQAAGEQNTRAAEALEAMMDRFMARLDTTFGEQMAGMREAMERTAAMMQGVEDSMRGLVQELRDAGRGMAEDMAGRLEQAMERVAKANEETAAQLQEFIARMREAGDEQRRQAEAAMREAVEHMRLTMESAGQSLSALVAEMRTANEASAERLQQQMLTVLGSIESSQKRLAEEMGRLAERIGEGSARQVKEMTDAVRSAMDEVIAAVRASSLGLHQGEQERLKQLSAAIEQLVARLAMETGAAGTQVARAVEHVTALLDGLREQVTAQDKAVRETMEQTLFRVDELLARMGGAFGQAGDDLAKGTREALEGAAQRLAELDRERGEQIGKEVGEAARRIADGSVAAGEQVRASVAEVAALLGTVRTHLDAQDEKVRATMDATAQGTREALEDVARRLAELDRERGERIGGEVGAAARRIAEGSAAAGEQVRASVASVAALLETVRAQLDAQDGKVRETMELTAQGVGTLLQRLGTDVEATAARMRDGAHEVLDELGARMATADVERARRLAESTGALVERLIEAAEQAAQRTTSAAESAAERTTAAATHAAESTMHAAEQTVRAAVEAAARTTKAAEALGDVVTDVVRELGDEMGRQYEIAYRSLAEVAERTGGMLARFEHTVGDLGTAAGTMVQAGETVAAATTRQVEVSARLDSASASLAHGAEALLASTREHAAVRESTRSLVQQMERILELAGTTGKDSAQAAAQMREAAEQLREAERVSREYLQNLSELVATAFKTFEHGMSTSIEDGVRALAKLNEQALGLYMGVIEELEGVTVRLKRA